MPSQRVRSRKHFNNERNVGNGVSPVEGTSLKGTVLKMLWNKVFIANVWSFFEHVLYILHVHNILQTTHANKGERYTDSWKMDVSILSQFFYNSYTYKLCFCILQCTHTVKQWLVIVANTHLGEGQVSATHNLLLFPFLLAPTEIPIFTTGQWGCLKAYFKRVFVNMHGYCVHIMWGT